MENRNSDFLVHYGVKGQKWGVRRFQNDDGSLTPEGIERYGGKKDRGDQGLIKKWTLGSEGGEYAFAKWRERRHVKNLEKAKASGNERKMQKYQSKLDAQSAANRNLDAYRKHSSTSKLVIQNTLGTVVGGNAWRHARARGSSRMGAFLETATPLAPILRMVKDKKAYGKYIVYGEPADGEYFADIRN